MYGVIHKIRNKINGKIYVGQTKEYPSCKRFLQHCTTKSKRRSAIVPAIRKYGAENFEFKVIDTACSREWLDKKERQWIAALNCRAPKGYNLSAGGVGSRGIKFTKAACHRISESLKGISHTREHVEKVAAKRRGCKHSIKSRRLMARRTKTWLKTHKHPMLGRKHSPETRKLLSESHKGLRYPNRKPRSIEARLKMSAAQILRYKRERASIGN
jgi:group I intron endonuclease